MSGDVDPLMNTDFISIVNVSAGYISLICGC